jgi:catalase-peroxidase
MEKPELFDEVFAKAWFKLTHRDMGPKSTYVGPEAPKVDLIWQDPIPAISYTTVDENDIKNLKSKISNSGLTVSEMVSTAWASASTYRESDRRGGANGARIRLLPQKNWEVNNPKQLEKVVSTLEKIQKEFNSNSTNKQVSIADLIVLAGSVGIEKGIQNAGFSFNVPFTAGRADAKQDQTDVESFNLLEPMADGFRNYTKTSYTISTEQLLIDKAQLLSLTVPEMTALIGGMRVLNANYDQSLQGVLTDKKEVLSNDFFVNLLSMDNECKVKDATKEKFDIVDRKTGKVKWTASRADLIFGSNSELRAISEVYAINDAKEKFVKDFIKAWTKVMNLDRFDLVK